MPSATQTADVKSEPSQKAVEVLITVVVGEVLSHDNHALPSVSFLLFRTVVSFLSAPWQHSSCPCQKLIYELILLSMMHI